MKISDLMLGDWVAAKGIDKPFRVLYNTYSAMKEQLCIFGKTSDGIRVGPFLSEEIQPIPLTPEILEKNRFKPFKIDAFSEAKNCIGKWWYKSGDIFVKQYCLDHESYRKGHTVFTLGWHPHSRVCNIRYVHELQHAMELCKIDKEIVL